MTPTNLGWVVSEYQPFREALSIREIPFPTAGPHSLVVRIEAAGINYPDMLMIEGKYQVKPTLPFVPGFEAVGTVMETGEGCSRWSVGDRVLCWTASGAFARFREIPEIHALPLPEILTSADAAALLVSYQTAYFALIRKARLAADEVVLVHSAAGALGAAAIEIAKAVGATVIATVGTPEKEAWCRELRPDFVLNHRSPDLAEEIRTVAGSGGVHVVVDPVGGSLFELSLKCLRPDGRILPLGFTSGSIPLLPVNRILLRNTSVLGLYWSEYWKIDIDAIYAAHAVLLDWCDKGHIRPRATTQYDFESLKEAYASFVERRSLGKSILLIS